MESSQAHRNGRARALRGNLSTSRSGGCCSARHPRRAPARRWRGAHPRTTASTWGRMPLYRHQGGRRRRRSLASAKRKVRPSSTSRHTPRGDRHAKSRDALLAEIAPVGCLPACFFFPVPPDDFSRPFTDDARWCAHPLEDDVSLFVHM